MDQLLITLINGVANGAVYGLVGLGVVIIFRSTDVMNFAMASMGAMAAYVALSVSGSSSIFLALAVGIVFAAVLGVVVREVVIRPLGEGRLFAALVVTMGVSLIVEHIISSRWGEQPRAFPRVVEGTVAIGDSRLRLQAIVVLVLAAVAAIGVAYLFKRTPLGSAMRAVAESAEIAQILGVNPHKVARIAWGLGMALCALGLILYAPNTGLTPVVFAPILFRAFAGIFLGGITSMGGALAGGIIIGVLDNLAAMYFSASFRDTFVFAIAILTLLIRPEGIFGRQAFARV